MQGNAALAGLKVLDLSRVLSGPSCAALLADFGADVIKIEEPARGDESRSYVPMFQGESAYFINFNRNKKGITLNLKSDQGKKIFLKLAEKADVVLENFRPGVMNKLGLDYQELKKVNSKIIFASISGFGQNGPYKNMAGYDHIAQAMSGMISVTGWPDSVPTKAGAPVADIMAGLNATIGILAALQYRNTTGLGQYIDISLVDVMVASLASVTQVYMSTGRTPGRLGNSAESAAPGGSCAAKDGFLLFAAGNPRHWSILCELIGAPQLVDMPEFSTNINRIKNRDKIQVYIEDWSKKRTVAEAVQAMNDVGIPAAPNHDIAQVVNDTHIAEHRKMFVEVEDSKVGKIKITADAIKMSETNPIVRKSAPQLGEHNKEIYMDILGLSENEIAELRHEGVI